MNKKWFGVKASSLSETECEKSDAFWCGVWSCIFKAFTICQHDAATIFKIVYTSQIEATIYPPLGKPFFSCCCKSSLIPLYEEFFDKDGTC